MRKDELEELHRLRVTLESVERRCQDAETAVHRIMEEVREARLSITLLVESAQTRKTITAPDWEDTKSWVLKGGYSS